MKNIGKNRNVIIPKYITIDFLLNITKYNSSIYLTRIWIIPILLIKIVY